MISYHDLDYCVMYEGLGLLPLNAIVIVMVLSIRCWCDVTARNFRQLTISFAVISRVKGFC